MSWNLFTIPRVAYPCLIQIYYAGRDCLSVGKGTFLRSSFSFLVLMLPLCRCWGMSLGNHFSCDNKVKLGHTCLNIKPVFPKWGSWTLGCTRLSTVVFGKCFSFYLLEVSSLFIISASIDFIFILIKIWNFSKVEYIDELLHLHLVHGSGTVSKATWRKSEDFTPQSAWDALICWLAFTCWGCPPNSDMILLSSLN